MFVWTVCARDDFYFQSLAAQSSDAEQITEHRRNMRILLGETDEIESLANYD